jgi:cob(I)alamin adenosyltransferase
MAKASLTPGIMQIYTGNGKGKTTTALGLALLAVGQGLKVYIVQFLKGRKTGESQAAARLAPDLTLRYFGRPGFVKLPSPTDEDLALVRQGWDLARQVIEAGKHDIVILDEINWVLANGFLPLNEVLEVLKRRPPRVGVILTGRQAPSELIALADQVIEMHLIKHYYQAGVKARQGIEW